MNPTPSWIQYAAECEKCRARARAWVKTHPGAIVQIQFRCPPGAQIVATIHDALKVQIIRTNPAGLQLILESFDPAQQTVLMLQSVLDAAFGHVQM